MWKFLIELFFNIIFAQGASDVASQLQAIVDSGAKVIVLNVIVGDAKTVFAQAEDVGITPENGFQWVGTDGATQDQVFTDDQNNVDTKLQAAMQGMIGTAPNRGSGDKYTHFLDLWEAANPDNYAGAGDRDPNTYATFAYDAVYAFAIAADNMIKAGGDPTDGATLLAELAKLEFTGATDPVSFDSNYDREGVNDIFNHDGTGFEVIGSWDKVNGMILNQPISYASGYGKSVSTRKSTTSVIPSTSSSSTDNAPILPGFNFILTSFSLFIIIGLIRKNTRTNKICKI